MTKTTDIGPLDWRIGIVDQNGRPTQEFQRRWNSQRGNNGLIGNVGIGLTAPPSTPTPSDGQVYIDAGTTPWTLYAGDNSLWKTVGVVNFVDLKDVPSSYTGNAGTILRVKATVDGLEFIGISPVLDALAGSSEGTMLVRGASNWQALAPGTSGYVLTSGGAGALPTWAAASGGGGGGGTWDMLRSAMTTVSPVTTSSGFLADVQVTNGSYVGLGAYWIGSSGSFVNATTATYTVPIGKKAYLIGAQYDGQSGSGNWTYYRPNLYNSTTSTMVVAPVGLGNGSTSSGAVISASLPYHGVIETANTSVTWPYVLGNAGDTLVVRVASAGDGNTRTVMGSFVLLVQ